ncbi:MAG: hypothetical protein KFB93_02565 [Simkaniaceae bacterium]|nr:MAG: hypothetical protein KFB93_02565 [Simkaniaceae bacterium]
MRISVSGTHFSGKSTLIKALLKALPNYAGIDEPYFLLEQEGYEFSIPPLLEDYEAQFKRSIQLILESRSHTIFDRCPLDFLGYAFAVGEKRVDLKSWIEDMEEAIRLLDLIIFLPIEYRDRIAIPPSEDKKLRRIVDENLQEIFLDDSLGILENIKVLEVTGSLEKRVERILPLNST